MAPAVGVAVHMVPPIFFEELLASMLVVVAVVVAAIRIVLVEVAISLIIVPAVTSMVSPEAQLPFEFGRSQHHCNLERLKLPSPHCLGTTGHPPDGLPAPIEHQPRGTTSDDRVLLTFLTVLWT